MSKLDVTKWPHYRTNKYVRAVKIAKMDTLDNGAVRIFPDGDVDPFDVTAVWMAKHTPEVGGYVIVYADGYMSWSPAASFDGSATRLDNGGANHRQGEAE
jgi:hypothetical protein